MNQHISILLCATLALSPIHTIAAGVGSKAPSCAFTSIGDGQRFDLKQFHGKVVYVDFWASWCPPCAKSFSFLNELNRDLEGKGLQVIGVNLDSAPEDAKKFLAKYPANFTTVADNDAQCAKDLNVKAMPSSYLIDRNGVIRDIHYGFRPGEAQKMRVLAEKLLEESPERR
ncbi:TlpA disulfide reductase family protein [Methylocaldum sp. MU1018]|jgi:peroxiredoxin